LERACPAGARLGTGADALDGSAPHFVAYPTSTAEVAAAMRVAASHGLAVVARGAGTKQDWGAPPERVDLVLDLAQMAGVTEHVSGDLVASVKAGTTLAALSEVLAGAAQWLPVDEVVPGSTIGGVVATGLSGPLRYGYGAVRDLPLGLTLVRADGAVVRAGSKVVKNVAGYDLAKLFTGSYGTLGVMTELTFKLAPVPPCRLFVTASYQGPAEAAPAISALVRSQAAPAAIELDRALPEAPLEVSVLVEGRPRPAEQRAAQVAALMGGAEVSPLAPPWWASLPGPATFKLTAALSRVPALVDAASKASADLQARLWGSAGAGVLYLGLPAGPAELAALLPKLREAAAQAQGYATLLRAPRASKAGLDIWGPVPGIELMRRVKERFDPTRSLAPGRFVGGI